MLILVLPGIQMVCSLVAEKPLQGDFIQPEKPVLNDSVWFNGFYQPQYEQFLNDRMGFKNTMIRLRNQVDYSLFDGVHAEGVVKGKDGYLFESDYIRAYFGEDFIGESIINKTIRELKFVQDYLKDSLDIDLVLVFEPGKASFYPEMIKNPPSEKKWSNYDAFLNACDQYNVEYIDFNRYYISQKGKHPYPLYTRSGIHWSIYGMSLVADSLLNYIEAIRGIEMGEAHIDTLRESYIPERTDNDVGKVLNLLWYNIDDGLMAYPEYSFCVDSTDIKPGVLVVGDSYYWNIFNTRIPKNLFHNEAFWYFYKEVYPETYFRPTFVGDLDFQAEIEKQDVIFLMVTERFHYKFDWGFISDLYKCYGLYSQLDLLYDYIGKIRGYAEWFDNVLSSSRQKNISLEQGLLDNGWYSFRESNPEKYFILRGMEHYQQSILNSPDWLHSVEKKAAEKMISVDQQIQEEASWIFEHEHPEWFEKNRILQQQIIEIQGDSIHMKKIFKLAEYYRLTPEEVILIEAEKALDLYK